MHEFVLLYEHELEKKQSVSGKRPPWLKILLRGDVHEMATTHAIASSV